MSPAGITAELNRLAAMLGPKAYCGIAMISGRHHRPRVMFRLNDAAGTNHAEPADTFRAIIDNGERAITKFIANANKESVR